MIKDFETTINTYREKVLGNYDRWDYVCPNPDCGARGKFTRHGCYDRFILFLTPDVESGVQERRIKVLRLMCKSCKTTHSILSSDMIPYWQYLLPTVVQILVLSFLDDEFNISKSAETIHCTPQSIYKFWATFIGMFYSVTIILREQELWKGAAWPQYFELLSIVVAIDLRWLEYYHLRKHGRPLFLNRNGTSRLFFGYRLGSN